jgi:hypothetical protein
MTDQLMILPPSALLGVTVKKRGHAARPGTGPEGETCGTCKHLVRRQMAKTYMKCGLTMAKWTGGAGSDIRHKDPACSKWEPGR